jgi:cobalt/nickel transport system ATP-binding protein
MTPPAVEFDHVGFTYEGAPSPALEDVSFSVTSGEALALMGPNGSGKSTALRLIVGLDHPQAGRVRVEGQEVSAQTIADRRFAKRLRQRVGLVFQDPETQLFCPSVTDEIAFGPRQMGLEEAEVERRVADCLSLFGLEGLSHRAPWQLSGGEKRRLAIACVISLAPRVLCLDEPTNDLDERGYAQLVAFLTDFVSAGGTTIVSTHDRRLVRDLGAHEVVLGRWG